MSSEIVHQMINRQLKVLILDYNPTCIMILEKMLKNCKFNVTKCQFAKEALDMLEADRCQFDIIITELYMPHVDGFELLKRIGLEMNLPVIMMSSDDDEDVIAKGMMCGAIDYLIKPIRIENIKYLWKYVVRTQRHGLTKMIDESDIVNNMNESSSNAIGNEFSGSGGEDYSKENSMIKKRKSNNNKEGDALVKDDATTRKKQRVIWTPELHDKFVAAVNHFGISKAVPKKILDLMSVPGLTRENVASHLQKYRQYLKRLDQKLPQQTSNVVNMVYSQQECLEKISSINEHQSSSQINSLDQPNLTNVLIEQQKQLIMQVTSDEIVYNTLPYYHHQPQYAAKKIVALDSQMGSYYGPTIEPNGTKMQMTTLGGVVELNSVNDNNQGIASHIEVGDNMIYRPIASYAYLEGCMNNEVGSHVNEDMTSIDGQSPSNGSTSHNRLGNNGHENALGYGYADVPLYMEQFDQMDYLVARFDQESHLR